jgi:hypothetical protein
MSRNTEAHLSELVEALVDVWRELDLPFISASIIPLRRPAASSEQPRVFPDVRAAAE